MFDAVVNQDILHTKRRHLVDILVIVVLHAVNNQLWYCATHHRLAQRDMALKLGLPVTYFLSTTFCTHTSIVLIKLLGEEFILIMSDVDKQWAGVAYRITPVLHRPFIFLRCPCGELGPKGPVFCNGWRIRVQTC